MIINGGSRRAGGWWAKHLENAEQNERVTLAEIAGLDAATIPDLLHEMEILARNSGSRTQNYFYQANVNPRDHEFLTPAQRHEAKELLLENLGLSGQPHFVVEHEKAGRVHFHVIAFRIDMERGRAISDSLTAQIHERTSRELEIRFDLARGKSVLVPDRDFERPERGAKKYEIFRGAQGGIDPERVKADARLAWARADSGVAFKTALEASGDYVLARGDRRDYLIIDRAGGDHSLARRLGEKAKAVRERMADLDPASLPNAEQAKAMQREQHVERAPEPKPVKEPANENKTPQEQMQDFVDSLPKVEPAPLPPGVVLLREPPTVADKIDRLWQWIDNLQQEKSREAAQHGRPEPPPEIVQEFQAAAARATEPAAPIFDRDAASRAADERIIDGAIKQAAPAPSEARQRPEPEAGAEPRGAAAEPAQAPPQAWEHDAAHELEATAEATVDRAAHAGEGVLRGLGKIFASFIFWLADSIAPPPPPTRDQAERMARSAEEKQEARAEQEAHAEREAQQFMLREIERSRQSADQRPTAAELYGTPKPGGQERDSQRERDRDYERER